MCPYLVNPNKFHSNYKGENSCKYYEKSLGVPQVAYDHVKDICLNNDVKNSTSCPFWKTYAP